VEGRFLLDVVVRKGPAVLELLAGEDQPLLVWRDALLVLDLCLDILDRVRRLNLEGDGLTCEGLDEDLHDDLDDRRCGEYDQRERGRRQVRKHSAFKLSGTNGVAE
jgi:hypothetical protein